MKIKEAAVNWGAIARMSKEFKKFVEATAELQKVQLSSSVVFLSSGCRLMSSFIVIVSSIFFLFSFFKFQVELQNICYPGRLTFWLNIFHTMVLHLHIIMGGAPSNLFLRRAFFSHYKYKIGKYSYSLNDIQHGILRGTVVAVMSTQS